MMYVIDTNAIIYAIKQKISLEKFLFEEIVVPSSVVEVTLPLFLKATSIIPSSPFLLVSITLYLCN